YKHTRIKINPLNVSILIIFISITLITNTQTKFRMGDGNYSSNKVKYTLDGDKLREGDGTYSWAVNQYLHQD
ncbi:MAG: hypothetical protein ACK452_09185, partial [Bacteroidota bacterium]